MNARDLKAQAKLPAGTRVRLTGQFLRDTGQRTGGEGQKTWTVEPCECGLCKCGPFVRVDEDMSAETDDDGRPVRRHINAHNLYQVGKLDHRNAG